MNEYVIVFGIYHKTAKACGILTFCFENQTGVGSSHALDSSNLLTSMEQRQIICQGLSLKLAAKADCWTKKQIVGRKD